MITPRVLESNAIECSLLLLTDTVFHPRSACGNSSRRSLRGSSASDGRGRWRFGRKGLALPSSNNSGGELISWEGGGGDGEE